MDKILVPTDGSPHANEALHVAGTIAAACDGQVVLLHTLLVRKEAEEIGALPETSKLDPETRSALMATLQLPERRFSAAEVMADPDAPCRPAPVNVVEAVGEIILNTAVAKLVDKGVVVEKLPVAMGDPAVEILNAAQVCQADMIVMGHRGLGELDAITVGSVSRQVTQKSPCKVVTVHAASAD